jgi:Domain of unknown function (DUF4397)
MRRIGLLLASVVMLGLGLGLSTAESEASVPRPAMVTFIQAVPGADVGVWVDERQVATSAEVGAVLGPFELAAGTHDVVFEGGDLSVESTLDVAAGDTSDVVLHLPAEAGGDPVVHSYLAPTGAIGPGKARVVLAHTATVAPADVQVDGETVFTNIANGEFADADVPAGSIEVALLPSGSTADPILGPLDVTLDASTLSMIYAYGNPRNGSMNVIAHTAALAPDGSVRPSRIDTGSAGLVTGPVTVIQEPGDGDSGLLTGVLAAVVVAGAVVVHRTRRRGPRAPSRTAG